MSDKVLQILACAGLVTTIGIAFAMVINAINDNDGSPRCSHGGRHHWGQWTNVDKTVIQQRKCDKCGYVQTLAF